MKLTNTNKREDLLKQIREQNENKNLEDQIRDQKLSQGSTNTRQIFDNTRFFEPTIEKLDKQIKHKTADTGVNKGRALRSLQNQHP